MPITILPIEEIDEAIIRPVIVGVTRDILEKMALPKDIPVMFKGNANQFIYQDTEFDSRKQMSSNDRFATDTLLYLETTIEDNENQLLSTPVIRPEERSVFIDKDCRVYMTPAIVNKKVDIQFKMTGTEKEVERWRATLRRKTSQGVIDLVHKVDFHYPIPAFFMYVLVEIYNKRNQIAAVGDTLEDYLANHFVQPYRVIANQLGEGTLFTIPQAQIPLYGFFDFGTNPPKPEKDSDVGLFSLDFTYSFYFDCPENVSLAYPIQVHNQLLAFEFLKTKEIPTLVDDFLKHGSISNETFKSFMGGGLPHNEYRLAYHPGLSTPWFDDWLDDSWNPNGYITLTRSLIKVNPTDRHEITNLGSYNNSWHFNRVVLSYLKQTRASLGTVHDSLFLVSIYRWGNLLDLTKIEVDENLNARYMGEELSLTTNYHMVVSFLYDITKLSWKGWLELMENGCMFRYVIYLLAPELFEKYNLGLGRCFNENDDLDKVNKDIKDGIYGSDGKPGDDGYWGGGYGPDGMLDYYGQLNEDILRKIIEDLKQYYDLAGNPGPDVHWAFIANSGIIARKIENRHDFERD